MQIDSSAKSKELPSLQQIQTLDGRWLEFVARTKEVFIAFPDLIPLRQTIFRGYVERKPQNTNSVWLKHGLKLAMRRQASSGNFEPVDVIFWLDSPREVLVEAVLPVIKQLQENNVKSCLMIAGDKHTNANFDNIRVIKFNAPYRWRSAVDWKRAWTALCASLPHDMDIGSFSAFLNDAYASTNIKQEAIRILSLIKPKIIVSPVDHLLPASAVISAAWEINIGSLVLLHGAVSPYNVPITADRLAAWGRVSHDQMVALGVSEQQLTILGSPRHDHFPRLDPNEARRRLKTLLGLNDNPYFVFFSNGNDPLRNSIEALEGCAKWLDTASCQLGDKIEFLVRLHPNEDGQLYQPYPQLKVFKNECDLDTVLGAVDICAALCSTTLSDGLLYHKPVLQFYVDGWPDLADNWRRGIAERISSSDQLLDFLDGNISHWQQVADQQGTHQDAVFANYPYAVDAVCEFIMQVIPP